jgi:hypothetical protein
VDETCCERLKWNAEEIESEMEKDEKLERLKQ